MTNTQKEVKAAKREANAPQRTKLAETIKTVVIAMLITGIVMFITGTHYQQHLDTDKAHAVSQATQSVAKTLK